MSARKHTRRAGYHSHAALIILLFCVCTVGVLAAYMLIEAGRKSITDQTTTALLQQAQARSSAVGTSEWRESTAQLGMLSNCPRFPSWFVMDVVST